MSGPVSRILARVLADGHGRVCSLADAALLLRATSTGDIFAIMQAADDLRRQAPCGPHVSYVVNRNINFTNACVKRCGFCAFSRTGRDSEAYYLPEAEVVRRAQEGVALGATEVCVQAGLPLKDAEGRPFTGQEYLRLISTIKSALPHLHIHALSPEEVVYGARTAQLSIKEFLACAKAAGVGSLPGTSAEILDDDIRSLISPGRLSTSQWVETIQAAHSVGLPTSATMMYGHVESPEHIAAHLLLLRTIQDKTGGFTEFVPLSFVAAEAPMYRDVRRRQKIGLRSGPTGREVLLVHAVARIMLAGSIDNIQVSWPKEGLRMAQVLLASGVNDLGGVLMNESISTAAGAVHGQLTLPSELRAIIRDVGRIPVQRSTTYHPLRIFSDDAAQDGSDLLDVLENPSSEEDQDMTARRDLGSYWDLAKGSKWRARDAWRAKAQTTNIPESSI